MNWERIEGSWDVFKSRVRQKWRRLSDQDLDAIAGRRDRLEDRIHERYGFTKEHIRQQVDDWSRWQTSERAPARTLFILARRGSTRFASEHEN